MKLTTKTRYGVRAAIDLAQRYKEGPVSVSSISKREEISVPYLEQLLNKLRKHGIVKSTRGPQGGYVLAEEPSKITVYDIVRVLEGDLGLVFCLLDKKKKKCAKMDSCITRVLWQKLSICIRDVLKSVTLEDLNRKSKDFKKEKKLDHKFTYSI